MRECDVAKDLTINESINLLDRETRKVKLDPFENAEWRKKFEEHHDDGTVTVHLSTGKKVRVNSKLLAFLRVLADELASKEETHH